jgi:hypothetical protein
VPSHQVAHDNAEPLRREEPRTVERVKAGIPVRVANVVKRRSYDQVSSQPWLHHVRDRLGLSTDLTGVRLTPFVID